MFIMVFTSACWQLSDSSPVPLLTEWMLPDRGTGTAVLINLEDIRDPEELLEHETELHLAACVEMFSSFDEQLTPALETTIPVCRRTALRYRRPGTGRCFV